MMNKNWQERSQDTSKYYTEITDFHITDVQSDPENRDYFTAKEMKWLVDKIKRAESGDTWYYVQDLVEDFDDCFAKFMELKEPFNQELVFNIILGPNPMADLLAFEAEHEDDENIYSTLQSEYLLSIYKTRDDWFWVAMNYQHMNRTGFFGYKCDGIIGLKKLLEDTGHLD